MKEVFSQGVFAFIHAKTRHALGPVPARRSITAADLAVASGASPLPARVDTARHRKQRPRVEVLLKRWKAKGGVT